jgi:hypothetical protein
MWVTVKVTQLTIVQVRQLLFFPEPADMALYPQLLAGDPANPTDLNTSAANKVRHSVRVAATGYMSKWLMLVGWCFNHTCL